MKRFIAILFLLCGLSAHAQFVTITLSVTNIPTNGATIAVGADVRTWTNSVTVPATQILIAANNILNASNLYNNVAANHFSGQQSPQWNGTSSNVIFSGISAFLTISTNWQTNTPVTNATTGILSVAVNASGSTAGMTFADNSNQVAMASGIVAGINASASNSLSAGIVMSNFPPLSGTNTFAGTNNFSATKGLNGNVGSLTNGAWTNPNLTNGINNGNPFRSIGSGTGAEQFGLNSSSSANFATALGNTATASGMSSSAFGFNTMATGANDLSVGSGATANGPGSSRIALGNGATATGSGSISVGSNSASSGPLSIAIGATASASGSNAVALGSGSAGFDNSTAIGNGATPTQTNQVTLGNSTGSVYIPGTLLAAGGVSNLITLGPAALSQTSTNTLGGVIVFPRFNNTGLANGVNQDVALGTNMTTKLSGPAAAFTTAGFVNGLDDRYALVENSTGFQWTINNQSGFESTSTNRIFTGTGADVILSSNSFALFKYDASVSLWKLMFASGSPSSGGSGSFSGSFSGNGGSLTNVTASTFSGYRAGFQAIGNLATSQAVTFTTPLASAVGTNYSVSISSDSTLASAVGFSAGSKTTNGFTITLSAGIAGGIGVDYTAIPYQ